MATETVNAKIMRVFNSLSIPCAPKMYHGTASEYAYFEFVETNGDDYGDDKNHAVVSTMQIHWITPADTDYLAKQNRIRKALVDEGFTFPYTTESPDVETDRHVIFECEIEDCYAEV